MAAHARGHGPVAGHTCLAVSAPSTVHDILHSQPVKPHHAVTQRHRSCEFVAFLQQLDAAYPAGLPICILLDNHSAHRSRETMRFLASRPDRFELVFTPTHASWLNWVEIFFSKMARSVLRHIRVASKTELVERIDRYIEICNESPLVPNWSYGISRDPQPLAA